VWYAIHVNFIFSVFFGLMFNLKGPQGQNPRTTCGPRTTVWETLGYRPNGLRFYSWQDREIFLFSKTSDRLWGLPRLLFSRYRCSFAGVKRPGLEVDHCPPSSVEVKNECCYTSTPSVCLSDDPAEKYTCVIGNHCSADFHRVFTVLQIEAFRGWSFIRHVLTCY